MGWTPKTSSNTEGDAGQGTPSRTRAPRRRRPVPSTTPNLDEARAANPRVTTGAKPLAGVRDNEEDPRRRLTVRLGKRWSEIVMSIKRGDYTWQEFVEGLDEEELARGRLKSADGSFTGAPSKMVPREFHLACQREQQRRFEEIFGSEVLRIARKYVELAQSPQLKEETRAKMMQYAMERIFGGIPKDVRINQAAPWEAMVLNVVGEEGQTGLPEHLARRYAGYAERQGSGEQSDA